MNVLTVCSGIGAPEVAWRDFGWNYIAGSDIEAFPNAVRAHHFPEVPNWGDMTKFAEWPDANVDLLVGGTPCQSFSVAGLRKGLADPRGNLALTFLAIASKYAPRWILWENVPGVLSSGQGRDFGAFLGGLGQCGYGWAYRVLDAQYFGVPQRRRRVFVVGHLGDWRRAAAVLFERHSLSGHPAPRREKGQSAPTIPSRSSAGGGLGTDFDCDGGLVQGWPAEVAPTLNAHFGDKMGLENQHALNGAGLFVAHSLRAEGFDASEDGTGRGTPIIPIDMRQASRGATMTNNRPEGSSGGAPGTGIGEEGDPSPTVSTSHVPAVAFGWQNSQSQGLSDSEHTVPTLDKSKTPAVLHSAVRRLTPTECEALQGFPRNYTLVPYRGKQAADGPRYKALGNSMAVPVMAWIGQRIAAVDAIQAESLAA